MMRVYTLISEAAVCFATGSFNVVIHTDS